MLASRAAPDAEKTARPRPLRMLWITAAWGACFVAIRWGLRDAPVLWFAALRSLVAGVVLLAVAVAQRRPMPRGTRNWRLIGLLAVTNAALAFAAMFAGVAGLATGTAAVLANAQPLLILLPAWWLYGERLTVHTAVGAALGFIGLIVVAVPSGCGAGAWLSILAATAITAGTLVARRLDDADVVQIAGWHFLLGGVLLVLAAAAIEGPATIDWTPRFVITLAFLGIVGTAAAYWAWFVETLRSPLSSLTAWTFLTPVFGVLFGYLLTSERLGRWTSVGIVLVLTSLAVALRHPTKPASADPTAS